MGMRADPIFLSLMSDSQVVDQYKTLSTKMLRILVELNAATTPDSGEMSFYRTRSPLALADRRLAVEVLGVAVRRTTQCSIGYRITEHGQRMVRMFCRR